MTDAERLRELANNFDRGYPSSTPWNCAAHLRRIADLLDAVPPETLKALGTGTWKAVPVEPTKEMKISGEGGWCEMSNRNLLERSGDCFHAMLSAAPAKPEG